MLQRIFSILSSGLLLFMMACNNTTEPSVNNSDIPPDPANINVPVPQINNLVPSATFTRATGNQSRIQINLLGLVNPVTEQPISLLADYTGGIHNFYLQEDGVVKGVKLTKVSSSSVLKADVVFTVDNSGSMSEEADSIAARIVTFANYLSSTGLDVRFGCVGYDGQVNGALNITTHQALSNYLNRGSYYTGTWRTYEFSGPDSAKLSETAWNYASEIWGENGVVGIFFADTMFNWRAGAQHVFVNFTDEPTQPGGYAYWSTSNLCDRMIGKGTVHTVFSEDTTYYYWQDLTDERPWRMSQCTGGTVKFISNDASDLNLLDLPVTGALSNSYLVEYLTSGASTIHNVMITVMDVGADGQIEYQGISY
jgi:hypothetical protein